ncbi:MAG: cell division protein FtsQ/DivIB [Desulfopila sp.]
MRRCFSSWKKRRSYLSRQESRKKYYTTAVKIAGILLCSAFTVGMLWSPVARYAKTLEFFWIKNIVIQGCTKVRPGDLRKIAGLDYKTSMFDVDNEQLRAEFVRQHWIRDARIDKDWPNKISISIEEHTAAALLVQGEPGKEKLVYINRNGKVIAPVAPGDNLDYPVVTGKNTLPQEEEVLYQDAVALLQLIGRNNPNLPAQLVSEINFDPSEGLVIRLVEYPFPIFFGRGEVKKKYRQLRKVLAVLYKKRRNSVDINHVSFIRLEYYDDKVLVAQSN